MSILLEALKKSEQERQLGQTPTLQSRPEDGAPGRESLNQSVLLALVVLSVCVMAWFGWQQLRMPAGPGEVTVAGSGEEVSGSDVEEAQPRTMTEGYQPATPGSATTVTGESGTDSNTPDDRAKLSQSVSTFTAEKADPKPSAKAESRAAINESPAKRTTPPAASTQPPKVAGIKKKTGDSQRTGVEPHVSEPISYWELPQGIRDNLPEIRITVLVYAEKPDDRFLLSNGQRMVEKDQLDGGLVLEEIRRDGAVFLYRNYRFLVKG